MVDIGSSYDDVDKKVSPSNLIMISMTCMFTGKTADEAEISIVYPKVCGDLFGIICIKEKENEAKNIIFDEMKDRIPLTLSPEKLSILGLHDGHIYVPRSNGTIEKSWRINYDKYSKLEREHRYTYPDMIPVKSTSENVYKFIPFYELMELNGIENNVIPYRLCKLNESLTFEDIFDVGSYCN